MRPPVVLLTALAFAGCATTGGRVPTLEEITHADVDAAVQIAADSGDEAGVECYTEIGRRLDAAKQPGPEVKGVLSAFALGRAAAHRERGGYGDALYRNCAPLVLDAEKTALSVARRVGGGPVGWAEAGLGFLRGLLQTR